MAVDVNLDAAAETVSLIRAENGNAEAVHADVTCAADIERVVERALATYGRIDILHYNVGSAVLGGCVELTEEQWTRAFRVNVTGCFLACKYVLPIMDKQGRGVILTTGSIAAMRWTGVDYVFYHATKAALIQLTRSVANHYPSRTQIVPPSPSSLWLRTGSHSLGPTGSGRN